uniref:Uncharacterized protein n=1 Tax=Parascaris univalens TaxID=6257 RepID=A0A915CDW4_PARUN
MRTLAFIYNRIAFIAFILCVYYKFYTIHRIDRQSTNIALAKSDSFDCTLATLRKEFSDL